MGVVVRVGIFAGTFDPVHNGHVAFAQAAREACLLDKIVFLPEPKPRQKKNITDIAHRVAMLQLLCREVAYFDVALLGEQQFTITESLPKLQQMFGTDITLLCGSDVAQSIMYWPHALRLMSEVAFAVGIRDGDTKPVVDGDVIYVTNSYAHVRATDIRQHNNGLVAPEVGAYMRDHRLYSV